MPDYISSAEIAKRWNVSTSWVTILCSEGRVPGAIMEKGRWKIPSDSSKPNDNRYKNYSLIGEDNFRFIDLFCGIGGFHQAMSKLGGQCVFACDINQFCREVYKQNFCPNNEFTLAGDINKAINDNIIPPFDVLCGGFPCQTFSKAGKQDGFKDDKRGQLFYRIIDILREHPECRYVVLENVRNLADKKENWEIVISELKEQGFIVTEEPIIESPHNFGIPQVRERVYILGVRQQYFDRRHKLPKGHLTREVLHINEKKNPCPVESNCLQHILEPCKDNRYFVSEDVEIVLNAWDEFKKNVVGIKSPFWIHKAGIGLYSRDEFENDPEIGYKEMPEWKKVLVNKSREMYENNYDFIDQWLIKYNMRERIMLHQKFEWNVEDDYDSMKDCIIQIRQSGVRVKRPNYFPSLVVMKNTPIIWDREVGHYRFITPKEAAKLQSFNEDFIFGETDSITYRQLGNAVNVELVKLFSEELFKLGKNIK